MKNKILLFVFGLMIFFTGLSYGSAKTLEEVKEYNIKTCMYSGDENIDKELLKHLNFYKIGGYKQELGGLSCKETNQRFYKINENEELEDITYVFRQKKQ